MDNTEAIGILRGTTSPASVLQPRIAADMGADALAAWEWVRSRGATPEGFRDMWQVYCAGYGYGEGKTPFDAVMDAMIKEAGGGR
jgi:hypothetical protein